MDSHKKDQKLRNRNLLYHTRQNELKLDHGFKYKKQP